MALKTGAEYIEDLKKIKPNVYNLGKKVEDVMQDPIIKPSINMLAQTRDLAFDPECSDIWRVISPLVNEEVNRWNYVPRSTDDLIKRIEQNKLYQFKVSGCAFRCAGSAAIFGLYNATYDTDQKLGTEYHKRFLEFLKYIQKEDLICSGCAIDVKGDRSLPPHQQADPDLYLRIVEERKNGIVVRGAKAHQTGAPLCHETVVVPSRRMFEKDRNYTVAFAVPNSEKGITYIYQHSYIDSRALVAEDIDFGIKNGGNYAGATCIMIFDDVFIPKERIFMQGEWEFTRSLMRTFAALARMWEGGCRSGGAEVMLGAAQAIAEYNGVARAANIREEMTELIYYLNTMKSLARASCIDCVMHGDMAIPNPVTANVAKYFYANNYHNVVKIVEDLCGGLLTTAPTYQDWQNSETGKFMDKYLGGRADASAEARLRILQTLRHYPCLGTELDVNNIHAEGSLMAERLTIYGEAREDLKLYKNLAEVLSGVTKVTWEEYVKLCQDLGNLGKGAQ